MVCNSNYTTDVDFIFCCFNFSTLLFLLHILLFSSLSIELGAEFMGDVRSYGLKRKTVNRFGETSSSKSLLNNGTKILLEFSFVMVFEVLDWDVWMNEKNPQSVSR